MSYRLWTNEPAISAGMSLRQDGDMRLPADEAGRDDVLLRRRAFFAMLTMDGAIAAPLLVHGSAVASVAGNEPLVSGHVLFPACDALVTTVPGVILTVTAADCLPVFLHDPVRGAVGIAHAGWRGLVATPEDVLAATVHALTALGSSAADLCAAIGPSIGPCHYAVDADRRARFAGRFGDAVVTGDALDLRKAAVIALGEAGVAPARIAADPPCTACAADRFFSHRVDRQDPPQAGMAWIMLRRPG